MWTWSCQLPLGRRWTRTASSKSRAVSPSMVTMWRPRKSCLSARSRSRAGATILWRRRALRLGEDVCGEDVGQVVLADDDFDVDAEGVGVAEDLEDATLGGRARVGKSVISTSTARPSRTLGVCQLPEVSECALLRRGCGVRCFEGGGGLAGSPVIGDEDGLGHALVEGVTKLKRALCRRAGLRLGEG